MKMTPILVRPKCSSSAVVAADSHPERENYFLLAFADGTAAVINAMHFFNKHEPGGHPSRVAYSGTGGEVAFIKGLHATGTSVAASSFAGKPVFGGYDSGTGTVGIGPKVSGITAVAFVPGRKAQAVTIGADGKCCVIDFTQPTPDKAILLRSWHLRRPATSLSVICYAFQPLSTTKTKAPSDYTGQGEKYCIAVGRDDGRVLLYNLDGKPLGEQTIDSRGTRVVDVEWESTFTPQSDRVKERIMSEAATRVKKQNLEKSPPTSGIAKSAWQQPTSSMLVGPEKNPTLEVSLPLEAQQVIPLRDTPEGLFSVAAQKLKVSPDARTSAETADFQKHTTRAAKQVDEERGHVVSQYSRQKSPKPHAGLMSSCSPPSMPPRPSPRPGGKLAMRVAQRLSSANVTNSMQQLATHKRPPGVVFGPREQPNQKSSATKSITSSDGHYSREQMIHNGNQDLSNRPSQAADTPSSRTDTDGQSFKTASSQFASSEDSNETVVDWSVSLHRLPAPSRQSMPLSDASLGATTHQRYNPALSSLSTQSTVTTIMDSSATNDSHDPDTNWPTKNVTAARSDNQDTVLSVFPLRPAHVIRSSTTSISSKVGKDLVKAKSIESQAMTSSGYSHAGPPPKMIDLQEVHIIQPSQKNPIKDKIKRIGHVSLPASPKTTNTATTTSSASEDQIVDWQSLKKSPRDWELDRKSSPTKYAPSATMAILENYTVSPQSAAPNTPRPLRSPTDNIASVSDIQLSDPRASLGIQPSPRHSPTTCPCVAEVQRLDSLFNALHTEVMQQFEAQRAWIKDLVQNSQREKRLLEEENEILRAELARLEKGKVKKRSPKFKRSWEEYKLGTPKQLVREV